LAKGTAGICSFCTSPHRREIDLALVAKVSSPVIAARFGVSRDSVKRHRQRHLSAVQAAALATAMKPSAVDLEALQRSEGESLLGQLLAQRATLQTYGQTAFEAKNYQAAISAERGVTANLDLLSKVLVADHHQARGALDLPPDLARLLGLEARPGRGAATVPRCDGSGRQGAARA
jgi:hypothetical protein